MSVISDREVGISLRQYSKFCLKTTLCYVIILIFTITYRDFILLFFFYCHLKTLKLALSADFVYVTELKNMPFQIKI